MSDKLKSYHSTFHLWEDKQKDYKLTDVLEIHFIEYTKFLEQVGDNFMDISKTRWLKGLQKNVDEKVVKELIGMEPVIGDMENTLDYIMSDPEMAMLYEAREKARLDKLSMVNGAMQQGREEERYTRIKSLLPILDDETIAKTFEVSVEEVQKIRISK